MKTEQLSPNQHPASDEATLARSLSQGTEASASISPLMTFFFTRQIFAILLCFTSATFNSFSIIDVAFKAEVPVAEAIQQLRSKMDDAEPELPAESTGREQPDFEQLSEQDALVLTLALTGDGLDTALLSLVAEDLQEQLESVQNVREVNLSGRREEVIHVQMLPSRLTTLGVAATQVSDAIQEGNLDPGFLTSPF